MKLKELKATYFRPDKKHDSLFPIGSTEQHGPFIPFGTDSYITDYLIEQSTKEFPELIVLPTLEISRSEEHRGFYGTVWLSEETLRATMSDVCSSLKKQARNIFITSFHANDKVIDEFIKDGSFVSVNLIHLEITNEEDDKKIQKIIGGEIDDHAGNTEISNMLVIDEKLVKIPSDDYPKYRVENPFATNNIIETCPKGIADNHSRWVISKEIGKRILNIYTSRMVNNLKPYINKK